MTHNRQHLHSISRPFFLIMLLISTTSAAYAYQAYPGTRTEITPYPYTVLLNRLRLAIRANHMEIVAQANASQGAAARGVKIPGNAIIMVFRNDFAVSMLKDSIAAGIETPIRIYLTANSNHTADITYRTPSALFRRYRNAKLNALAKNLTSFLRASSIPPPVQTQKQ